MRPELKKVFDEQWERNRESMEYLAGMSESQDESRIRDLEEQLGSHLFRDLTPFLKDHRSGMTLAEIATKHKLPEQRIRQLINEAETQERRKYPDEPQ